MGIAVQRDHQSVNAGAIGFGFAESNQNSVQVHFQRHHFSLPNPQIALLGEIERGWSIIRPLLVAVEQDKEGSLVLSDDEFLVYGVGDTLIEAKQDYFSSLIEYYELLARHNDAPTQALFRRLRLFLRATSE
jgi:hypothetical protein